MKQMSSSASPGPSGTTGSLFPVTSSPLPRISGGEGVYLFDEDGRTYLDGSSGAVAANLGHGSRAMASALADQANQVAFAHRTHFRSTPVERLCKLVGEHTPGDLRWCMFTSSGSEANEIALRLALSYGERAARTAKRRVVSRKLSYHGSTMGALSLTGQQNRRVGIGDLLHEYPVLDEQGLTPQTATPDQLVHELDDLNPATIAAVFTETISGTSGGAIVPPPGYYEALRAWCTRNDVIWVADEVMSGFGRTGCWFASEHWDAIPDIIVFGKGVSGGYAPLAGVVAVDKVAHTVLEDTGYIKLGHTFSNVPITAAVGVAAVEEIERRGLVENAHRVGNYLGDALDKLALRTPLIGEARGIGLMRAIELIDPTTGHSWDNSDQVMRAFLDAARSVGLLLYPAGRDLYGGRGVAAMITPPLVITLSEADELVDKLEQALATAEPELASRFHK